MKFGTGTTDRPRPGQKGTGGFPLANRRRAGRQDVSPDLLPLLRSPAGADGVSDWPIVASADQTNPNGDDDQGPGFLPAMALSLVAGTSIWIALIWLYYRL